MDLLVRNATLVTDGLEMQADLGVAKGRVCMIGRLDGIEARETIDATGKIVVPGLVELGVSLESEGPNYPASRQSFDALTREALLGGVTTLVTAVRWDEERPTAEELAERKASDRLLAHIDFAYHYFLDSWTESRKKHLRAALVSTLSSVWIARTGLGSEAPGATLLHAVMRELPPDAYAIATPSDPLFEHHFRTDLNAAGQIDAKSYGEVFPPWTEAAAIRTLGPLMRGTRSRLAVLGLSGHAALEELQRLREAGIPILGGAKLAHLALSTDMLDEQTAPTMPFVWPPLRGRGDQNSLWHALDNGLVNLVTSSHHPRTNDEVRSSQKDATSALGGTTALSHLLPLLYAEGVAKWRLSLESLSVAACADPAKLAGLYPRKGTLQVGSDADFVVLDPSVVGRRPQAGSEFSHYDPFAGVECPGAIEAVYLRGVRALAGIKASMANGQYLEGRPSLH